MRKVELDAQHNGVVKVNTIADLSWDMVSQYIESNNVPYNILLDEGCLSVGCAPCTRPVKPREDPRRGRW